MVQRTVFLVALLQTVASAIGRASAANVVIPAHTHVILIPKRTFLASDVRVGRQFDLTIQDPIIRGGYVAIPDGARARAHVVSNGASLRIVFDWIQAPGKKIGLDRTPYDVRARGTDGKRHRFFFGLFRAPAAIRPELSQQAPLDAMTARSVHIVTNARATKAQKNAALRKYLE